MPATTSKTLTVSVTPEQSERAVQIASARMTGHNHCRSAEEQVGAGGSGNWLADWIGALGEVVIVDMLNAAGITPQGWIPVSTRPPVGADFRIGALACDVKATPPGRSFWNINEKQFQNRTTDLYLPIQFIDPETACIFKAVSAATIATWPIRHGNSQYRGCPISQLCPIQKIEQLFG
jgi:hypothetical protein